MPNTGFTTERAAPHEQAVWRVLQELNHRGYATTELMVDGDRPDARINLGPYIEVKTGSPNLAVKVGSLETYETIETTERVKVRVVWLQHPFDSVSEWRVCTPNQIREAVLGGPRSPTAGGSNTAWFLCRLTGEPFDSEFPSRLTG